MSLDPERDMIRLCRRLILEYLNVPFPGCLPEMTICEAMVQLSSPIPPRFVQRDLGYLAGRGLLKREDREDDSPQLVKGIPRLKVAWWSLTSAGVLFVERGFPWSEIEGF